MAGNPRNGGRGDGPHIRPPQPRRNVGRLDRGDGPSRRNYRAGPQPARLQQRPPRMESFRNVVAYGRGFAPMVRGNLGTSSSIGPRGARVLHPPPILAVPRYVDPLARGDGRGHPMILRRVNRPTPPPERRQVRSVAPDVNLERRRSQQERPADGTGKSPRPTPQQN